MSSSVYADEEGLAQTLSYLNSPLPLSSVHNVSTPSSDDAHSAHQSHSIPLPDILKASALTILVVWTILANFLVFIVLYKNPRLQTVPNLLVGNLAFSDFCLAMIVLPLSSVYACAGEWLFNETLCQVFVSADILCSTASIWNLSIVGLDRYWAITHPVQYLNKRNKKTACLMIVSCWCFSALISLAPLLGWKQVAEHGNLVQIKGQWQCTFLDLPSYTVYSATGSFFIPTLLMFFVYFKIYQAFAKHRARQIYRQKLAHSTRVIRRHIESTILHEISHILPTSDEFAKEAEDEEDEEEPEEEDKLDPQGAQMGAREVEQQLKRRTPLSTPMHDTIYEEEEEEEDDAEEEERDNIKFEDDCHSEAKEQRNGNVAKQHKDGPIGARERSNSCGGSGSDTPPSAVRFSGATIVQQAAPERAGPPCSVLVKTKRQWRSQSEAGPKRECSATVVKFSPKGGTAARVAAMREAGNESTTVSRRPTKNGSAAHHNAEEKTMPPYEKVKRHKKRKELNFRKSLQGKPRAISAAKERRGVRVLGIILGCFTLCWTPFFIMYVLVQFCAQCAVNPHIEMFITWLGYSNSAMNPIIYTVFNRDYQIALKRLFVGRKAMMGSSGGGVRPPMPLPSYLANKPKH